MNDHPHLNEIKSWEGYGSTRWVRPRDVVGIDFERARALNKTIYVDGYDDIEDESDDEVVVDYLYDLIKDPFVKLKKNIRGVEIVDAALFLIDTCWSVAAAQKLGACGDSMSETEVEECVVAIRDSYRSSTGFARKLVRSFALDFLDYSGRDSFGFIGRLTKPLQSFLDSLLENAIAEID